MPQKPSTLPYDQGQSSGWVNRANEMNRSEDTVKVPKITLYDIDFGVFAHLSQNFRPKVNDNGNSIDVPIMYANGEKWSQIRAHGYARDANKKVLAPLMVIRRVDVSEDTRISMAPGQQWNAATAWFPKMKMVPHRTTNMQYDRIAGQYLSKNSFEYYLIDVPDYVRVNYELIIWTDLQEQMNPLVHGILAMNNHMWGDYWKFRTTIQSTTHDNVNVPGEDRLVKTTMSLQVDGYLRNEFEYHQSKIQKAYSLKRVDFMNETTDEILFNQIQDLNQPNPDPRALQETDQNGLRRNPRL